MFNLSNRPLLLAALAAVCFLLIGCSPSEPEGAEPGRTSTSAAPQSNPAGMTSAQGTRSPSTLKQLPE